MAGEQPMDPGEAAIDASTAPSSEQAVALARKLVGLAREQRDAWNRGAGEQFEWVSLRRDDVTAKLEELVAGGVQVKPAQTQELHELRKLLASLDEEMQSRLKQRIVELATRKRRFNKDASHIRRYLTIGPRHPSFIDKRQ